MKLKYENRFINLMNIIFSFNITYRNKILNMIHENINVLKFKSLLFFQYIDILGKFPKTHPIPYKLCGEEIFIRVSPILNQM